MAVPVSLFHQVTEKREKAAKEKSKKINEYEMNKKKEQERVLLEERRLEDLYHQRRMEWRHRAPEVEKVNPDERKAKDAETKWRGR